MSQVALEFMYVVNTSCTPLSVLAVDGLDSQTSRSHTKYKGILNWESTMTSTEMRGLVADLRAYGTFIFCIPLNCKMSNRFLVFVLQKAEGDKGAASTPLNRTFRDVLEIYGHSRPDLK